MAKTKATRASKAPLKTGSKSAGKSVKKTPAAAAPAAQDWSEAIRKAVQEKKSAPPWPGGGEAWKRGSKPRGR